MRFAALLLDGGDITGNFSDWSKMNSFPQRLEMVSSAPEQQVNKKETK